MHTESGTSYTANDLTRKVNVLVKDVRQMCDQIPFRRKVPLVINGRCTYFKLQLSMTEISQSKACRYVALKGHE